MPRTSLSRPSLLQPRSKAVYVLQFFLINLTVFTGNVRMKSFVEGIIPGSSSFAEKPAEM